MTTATEISGLLLLAAGALLLAALTTPIVIRAAVRFGYVDHPQAHKSHEAPTPYGGGIAFCLAAVAPIAMALGAARYGLPAWLQARLPEVTPHLLGGIADRSFQAASILGGIIALFVLGLIDDLRPLGPRRKLLMMLIVAAATSYFGDVRLLESQLGVAGAVALTTVWIVVITNAFNFLDNMDGLSAGVGIIGLAFLAVCGIMAEQLLVPALAAMFAGAALGFLIFNFPPATIFMGDAGSLPLGYALGVVSVLTTYWRSDTGAPYAIAMPCVLLAVPLYDFVSVVVIRLFEGRNPLRGDQRHFSHRLVDRGLSKPQAVFTIYLATATTGLAATLLPGADLVRTLTVVALVIMVLAIIAILEAPLRSKA